MGEVITEEPEVGESDATRLHDPNSNSPVVLQNALWRARDGEEAIFNVFPVVGEFFLVIGIDEYDCPLVFISGDDNPVSAGPDLAFNFGGVGDNLELPEMLTRFPALFIGQQWY